MLPYSEQALPDGVITMQVRTVYGGTRNDRPAELAGFDRQTPYMTLRRNL
jgi:hypothetical protein